MLGLGHQPLHGPGNLLAEGQSFLQRESAAREQAGHDALGLPAGLGGGLAGLGPPRTPAGGAEAEPDEAGQHLAGDAGRPLLHALEDHLGHHHGAQVLARALVLHAEVLALSDHAGQVPEHDVAALAGVVELAVVVPADQVSGGGGLPRHGGNLTHRVMEVKTD